MRKRYSKPNGANVICHLQAAFVRFVAEETNGLCDLSKEPSFCLYYLTVWQSCRTYSNLEFSFCSADIPHWLHNFPSAGLNFICLILATNPQKAPGQAPEIQSLMEHLSIDIWNYYVLTIFLPATIENKFPFIMRLAVRDLEYTLFCV